MAKPTQEFLKEAQDRFKLAAEAESQIRQESLEDWNFALGDQWPSDIRTQRVQDARPCLTMNRLLQFTSQVTNDQRQQRPAIRVNPVGNGADEDTADIEQGIIRHIEVRSDAEIARDTAFEQMVIGGVGHYRVLTEWADETGWDQEIRISRILNPFSVFGDPSAIEPDRSDRKWLFIVRDYTPEEYKAEFPGSELASLTDFTALGVQVPGWFPNSGIRVAEYFHVDENKRKVYLTKNGQETDEKPKQEDFLREREITDRQVLWAKINAVEILEQAEIPCRYIPIVSVFGRESEVDGQYHCSGLVRFMKDPQRQYNYFQSASTEAIALAPKSPWIIAEGQTEGYEQKWANANIKNFSTLEYKPVSLQGSPLPPPQRNSVEPPIQAMTLMIRQADADLKSISGLNDPSLGENPKDQSGKAIQALQRQGQVGNVNWVDNLSRSIRFEGRILVDMIPRVYDSPRVQRIIDPDGTNRHVVVHNGPEQAPAAQQMLTDQISKIYDIGTGKYDITISVGPSYQTKRQDAVASLMALVSSYPPLMQVAGDLLMQNMDIPGAEEIADRLKKLLPPQVLEGTDPQNQLAATQAQLQQLSAQHQQLSQLLAQQHDIIQGKVVENNAKIEIEKLRDETAIAVAEINTKAQELKERLIWQRELEKQFHVSAHEAASQVSDQVHEQALSQQAQEARQQMASQAAQQQPSGKESAPVQQ